jgi:hypothetical protein
MRSDFYRKKKFSTFIELSSGLGISKNVQHLVAPSGGKYVSKAYLKLPYYSGSIGAAFRLNQCFKLNLSAKFQKTIEKESNRSDSVSQHSINDNIEISPMLSVSYIFKGKVKTQE